MRKILGVCISFSLFFVLIPANHLITSNRGIKVKTLDGKRIDLYQDSYALVVGRCLKRTIYQCRGM